MKRENWAGYSIRFVERSGEWWAVAQDVCEALGLKQVTRAIRRGEKRVLGKDSTADACVAGLGKGPGTARRGKADKSYRLIKVNTIQHDLCDIILPSKRGLPRGGLFVWSEYGAYKVDTHTRHLQRVQAL